MRFWVGVTDNRWFDYISRHAFDEVNFWQPSAKPPFTTLPAGTPFLFKLKKPFNCIAGFGYFVRYTQLPLPLAWDAFADRNGARSLAELRALITSNSFGPTSLTPEIGCTVVTGVTYLPKDRWIPMKRYFSGSIVRGRTYDSTAEDGAEIWNSLQAIQQPIGISESNRIEEPQRFGKAFLMHARLGQGSFRTLVIDAYQRRCAITGESTLPALEAAHIRPYADEGPHRTNNGLLLRSDFHKLFDSGLVTVEPDYTIRISGRIRERYFNGKAYYRLHAQPLVGVPDDPLDRPSPEFLRWHNNERFLE